MTHVISPAVRTELAPTGTLRVGLKHGNFLLVTPGSSATDPLGVRVGFFKYDTAGALADAVRAGVWDMAFLAPPAPVER